MIRYKWRPLIVTLFVFVGLVPLSAANWNDSCADLARDITAVTGPGAVALSLRNVSSIAAEEVPAIRLALETQLRSAGVRVVNSTASAREVNVTLSENVEGYLWIAAIHDGTNDRVVMRKIARIPSAIEARSSNTVVLRKTLLWSQAQPILDAAVFQRGLPEARLVVLDPEKVSLLRFNAGQWAMDQMLAVTHARPFPRDVRGRLAPGGDHLFDAYLPGVVCRAAASWPLAMVCRESDDPWPLQPGVAQTAFFGAARNFFPGDLAPGIGQQTSMPAFYSAAAILPDESLRWVFAGLDGQLRLTDGSTEVVPVRGQELGSDVAAIKGACGPVLLGGAGADDTAPDSVRAYEVTGHGLAANSQPIEFPGPVTALWSSGDDTIVTAVAHNLKTRMYEAYSITISCP